MSYGKTLIKLPSEQHLPPVRKFNELVGPLLQAMKPRLPLDTHHEESLLRSLTSFIQYAYDDCFAQLEKSRPRQIDREEWMTTPEDVKREHMLWQSNLRYLRQRLRYYMQMLEVQTYMPKYGRESVQVYDGVSS